MYLYRVTWKVRSMGSLTKDSTEATNVRANSEEEAIEDVKRKHAATLDRMYDFEARRIG